MTITKFVKKIIFGEEKEIPLSRRILILITFYTLIIALAGNLVNIFLGFSRELIILTSLAFLLMLVFFLIARNSRYYEKTIVPLFILSLLFIVLTWILNAGYDGNTINLMFVYFIGLYVIFHSQYRFIVFISFILIFSSLSLIQYLHPEYIYTYDNSQQRFADIFLGNIVYFLFIYFVVDLIIRNYSSENAKVVLANKQLLLKNAEIEVSTRKLAESEEKFRMISEQLPDVLFVTDVNGIITYLSPATETVFGILPEEMVGHAFIEFLHEDDIPSAINHFQQSITGKENKTKLPLRIRTNNNKIKHIELNATLFYKENSIVGTIGVIRDIQDRKLAEEKILKLSKGIEQSPASILITDKMGNIEYVNPKFTEITGYSFDEACGQNPRILFSGFQDRLFYEDLWEKILSGEEWRGEIKNKKKNGELYWEFASIFPIKNDTGEIGHFVAVKEDITQRKSMEAELIEAKNKAEESDRLKSAFLANMSHEIRTPLNGILGFTNLLEKENVTKEQKERYSAIIRKSAKGLLQIINDILDISRIESGQLVISKTTFEINTVFKDLYLLYSSKLKELETNSTIALKIKPTPEKFYITTDESRLRQIFINLLDNSLKFTEQGSIEFGVHTIDENSVQFIVSDTGIGIPIKMQKIIFNRFTQVKTKNNTYRGNGLGLSIVKQLIELMGGSITLKSKPGSGSSFYFSLPIKNNADHKKEVKNHNKKNNSPSDITILIIEDNDANRIFLEELLSLSGYKFEISKNGKEALNKLNETDFDILLMDVQLPDIDGIELVRKIRVKNKKVRIIAQTAYAMSSDEQNALDAGCNDFVSKPIDIDALLNKIETQFFEKNNQL